MRVLITTDAFPPNCGGSGWSTYELVRGLIDKGHEVFVIQPSFDGRGRSVRKFDGISVAEYRTRVPRIPYLRNYFKNERFYRHFADYLEGWLSGTPVDVVHAQHLLTGPPSITAARARGLPVVCTVRDYWPICYWTDLLHDEQSVGVCPECTQTMMSRCIRPRAGAAWPFALPFVPYMKRYLEQKRKSLALSSAVVAVSQSVAERLRNRAPEIRETRLEIIPNPVDSERLLDEAPSLERPLNKPYVIYLGKLAANKGVRELIPVMEKSRVPWPLVVVGDGAERGLLERQSTTSNCQVEFTGWLNRPEALQWLYNASILVFPSRWPEPLSRVLLEASAIGIPIAAMDTGGSRDIVVDQKTGLLSQTSDGLAQAVADLYKDERLRQVLAGAAKRRMEAKFSTVNVISQMEALYGQLIGKS